MIKKLAIAISILASGAAASAQDVAPPGSLTRADFIVQMDAEFRNLDIDSSGVVLPDEIVAVQRAAAQSEAFRQNQAVFANLDADANGQLSPQEFAALANPDAIAVSADPLLQQFDTDKDGAITLVEYRIATQGNFDRIDSDRDGLVTQLEMQAAGIIR